MTSELHHLTSDREAIRWALGCVVTSIEQRVVSLMAGTPSNSRWILLAEMLLCFVPLTLGWLDAILGTLGVFGIIRLNGQIDFANVYGGALALVPIVAGSVFGALGPLSLIAAFRLIVLRRQASIRWIRHALIVAPLLYGVLILATRLAIGGVGALRFHSADSLNFWSAMVFLSALPTVGAAHILVIGRRNRDGRLAS